MNSAVTGMGVAVQKYPLHFKTELGNTAVLGWGVSLRLQEKAGKTFPKDGLLYCRNGKTNKTNLANSFGYVLPSSEQLSLA